MEDCRTPTAARVSRADVLAELPVVERIVRDGYSGFDEAKGRVDFDRLFAKARADAALLPDTIEAERYGRWVVNVLDDINDRALQTWVETRNDKGEPHVIVAWARGELFETHVSEKLFRREGKRFRLDEGAGPFLSGCQGLDLAQAMRPALVPGPLRARYRLMVRTSTPWTSPCARSERRCGTTQAPPCSSRTER
jgi:hypothetical protein